MKLMLMLTLGAIAASSFCFKAYCYFLLEFSGILKSLITCLTSSSTSILLSSIRFALDDLD